MAVDKQVAYGPESCALMFFTKDHTKLACAVLVNSDNWWFVQCGEGQYQLFGRGNKTWVKVKVLIRWDDETFDITFYDRDGTKITELLNRSFYNQSFWGKPDGLAADVLAFGSNVWQGNIWLDEIKSEMLVFPSLPVEAGILVQDKLLQPSDAGGYWIVGYWMRKVRAIYDKTLADDHNIARAILNKIKDIEAQKT
jgi:hypothetical protein